MKVHPLTNDAQPAIIGDFLPRTARLQWSSAVRIEISMAHGRGIAQNAAIRVYDIDKARITGTQSTIGAVALKERQCRIQCRNPSQLNAPLLQLLARKAGHLGTQAETNQMYMLRGIPAGHQIAQKPGQVACGNGQILHSAGVPGHSDHGAPVDQYHIVIAASQKGCGANRMS